MCSPRPEGFNFSVVSILRVVIDLVALALMVPILVDLTLSKCRPGGFASVFGALAGLPKDFVGRLAAGLSTAFSILPTSGWIGRG